MPDLQIFIISPPDNLIMQRCRIHFSPLREPVRDALFPDYFPALPAALYKPTRTPSIMLFSPFLLSPQSSKLESCNVPFCLALLPSYNNNSKGSLPENSLHRQQSTFLFKKSEPFSFLHTDCNILQKNSSRALLIVKRGKKFKLKSEVLTLFVSFLLFPFFIFFILVLVSLQISNNQMNKKNPSGLLLSSFIVLVFFFFSFFFLKIKGKQRLEIFRVLRVSV